MKRKLKFCSNVQAVTPVVVRRIMRELKELDKNPLEGIRIQTNDEDMLDVTGIIEGPGE
jgi:ubiquitin-conjugating enzyme E2 S